MIVLFRNSGQIALRFGGVGAHQIRDPAQDQQGYGISMCDPGDGARFPVGDNRPAVRIQFQEIGGPQVAIGRIHRSFADRNRLQRLPLGIRRDEHCRAEGFIRQPDRRVPLIRFLAGEMKKPSVAGGLSI